MFICYNLEGFEYFAFKRTHQQMFSNTFKTPSKKENDCFNVFFIKIMDSLFLSKRFIVAYLKCKKE